MTIFSSFKTNIVCFFLVATSLTSPEFAAAQLAVPQTPPALSVAGQMSPLPPGVADLKFHEFFKMPVGPGGLAPSKKLLGLNGKRVRIIGYMAQQETPSAGVFILSPIPVSMGDEDEGLADNLPPNVVFVHLEKSDGVVPFISGLLKLTGVLSVSSQEEADGRVSSVRLLLDPELTQAILHNEQERHARNIDSGLPAAAQRRFQK